MELLTSNFNFFQKRHKHNQAFYLFLAIMVGEMGYPLKFFATTAISSHWVQKQNCIKEQCEIGILKCLKKDHKSKPQVRFLVGLCGLDPQSEAQWVKTMW